MMGDDKPEQALDETYVPPEMTPRDDKGELLFFVVARVINNLCRAQLIDIVDDEDDPTKDDVKLLSYKVDSPAGLKAFATAELTKTCASCYQVTRYSTFEDVESVKSSYGNGLNEFYSFNQIVKVRTLDDDGRTPLIVEDPSNGDMRAQTVDEHEGSPVWIEIYKNGNKQDCHQIYTSKVLPDRNVHNLYPWSLVGSKFLFWFVGIAGLASGVVLFIENLANSFAFALIVGLAVVIVFFIAARVIWNYCSLPTELKHEMVARQIRKELSDELGRWGFRNTPYPERIPITFDAIKAQLMLHLRSSGKVDRGDKGDHWLPQNFFYDMSRILLLVFELSALAIATNYSLSNFTDSGVLITFWSCYGGKLLFGRGFYTLWTSGLEATIWPRRIVCTIVFLACLTGMVLSCVYFNLMVTGLDKKPVGWFGFFSTMSMIFTLFMQYTTVVTIEYPGRLLNSTGNKFFPIYTTPFDWIKETVEENKADKLRQEEISSRRCGRFYNFVGAFCGVAAVALALLYSKFGSEAESDPWFKFAKNSVAFVSWITISVCFLIATLSCMCCGARQQAASRKKTAEAAEAAVKKKSN
jgi:hypothetical protein